ncbi:MAG: AmmeMemoRadiSam system protein B [Candidatus Hadarchaeota archaeon]
MRPPAVAGQFYAGTESALLKQIEKCYLHHLGPGRLPKVEKGERSIRGAVVPHAGYDFSGPIAAHVFGAIAEDGLPDTFIIIGPDHHGYGSGASITTKTFTTPLGQVPVNRGIAEKMRRPPIEENPEAHAAEHSLEVQLPFLQHLKREIRFVPVCMTSQGPETAEGMGELLARVVKNDDVVILASSDFSHVGANYFQPPPHGMNAGEFAKKQDELAIEPILEIDPTGLFKAVEKNNISMCGYGCVASMLHGIKGTAKKGTLLKYATSYDVWPSSSAVGYGAIVFR